MAQGGFKNLLWFLGVVEDRSDPRRLGRIKVRCFDIHPDNKDQVPTEDLPWAIPVLGGYDTNYKPPLEGSWVFGFFLDGEDAQHPMVMGLVPGVTTTSANPDGAFSGFDYFPKVEDLYQPDMPRLSRGENIEETNVARRYINRESNIGYGWEEPNPPYNAEYPYNKIYQTESGHVMEFDDTPGSERINIEHLTGTFTEIAPNGSKTTKVVGDNYTIVESNDKIFIKGNADVVIYGAKTVNIEGDCNLTVDGTMKTTVHGDYNLDVAGAININSGQTFFLKSSGIRQEAYLDSINHYARENYHVQARKNVSLHANTGTMSFYSLSTMHQETGATYNVFVSGSKNEKIGSNYAQQVSGTTSIDSIGAYKWHLSSTYNREIEGASYFRFDGDRSIHLGADTYSRHDTGVNYSCSTDPVRTSTNDCTDVLGHTLGSNGSAHVDPTPSLRTLLGNPPDYYFTKKVNLTVDPYSIFTDPVTDDPDTHDKED